MGYPKVSIITPSYNQGQFIEETITSVLNQGYSNIEYIIVDGGSTDNTMQIIEKYRNQIDIIIYEKDKGQSDAINKGFKLATGELVGWINSDDILYSSCVEEIVKLYRLKPDGSIYYCPILDVIDYEGNKLTINYKYIKDKKYLLNKDCDIIQPSSFYKKDILDRVDYLDENLHYCMDLDLWLKLLDYAPLYYTGNGRPLSGFRRWTNSKTTTGGRLFLNDIKKTLLRHGATRVSKTFLRLYYYSLKARMRNVIYG